MIIELAPDYDLFVKMFFVLWVLSGTLKVCVGVVQADKPNRDTYGIIEVFDGGLVLLLSVLVIS